jgi:hypothetical protein
MKLALPTTAVLLALWPVSQSPAHATPFPGAGLIPQSAPDLIETVQRRRGGAVRRDGVVARRGTAVAPEAAAFDGSWKPGDFEEAR